MKGRIFSRNGKGPADIVLGKEEVEGAYLFDDGTIGYVREPEFEIEDYLDDGEEPEDLRRNGRMPIGNIYIDRWRSGAFIEGGCYLYYEKERLRDYCERNEEPLPMRRIPDGVWERIEQGDIEGLGRFLGEVPELKAMLG